VIGRNAARDFAPGSSEPLECFVKGAVHDIFLPALAENSGRTTGADRAPARRHNLACSSADSVDQAYTSIWQSLSLPQLKPTTTFRLRKERLPPTDDQRIDDQTEFIHQSGFDEARRRSSPPNEIDILAGLPLEGGNPP